MLYLAYGSNLNLARFTAYLASHGIHPDDVQNPRRAILPDHSLRTNYLSVVHGAGACNIEAATGHVVEGVVVNVTEAVRSALRAKEGWPNRYEETEVEVIVPPAKKCVTAFTYAVHPLRRLDRDQPVTSSYRRLILDGAKAVGLSPTYQVFLRQALNADSPHGQLVVPDRRDLPLSMRVHVATNAVRLILIGSFFVYVTVQGFVR